MKPDGEHHGGAPPRGDLDAPIGGGSALERGILVPHEAVEAIHVGATQIVPGSWMPRVRGSGLHEKGAKHRRHASPSRPM
jgi:hypothetical protein